MNNQPTLSDAIDTFIASRASEGISKGTLAQDRGLLRRFLTVTGNIYVRNVTHKHIDDYFAHRVAGGTVQASTLNHELAKLKVFFQYAEARRWLGRTGNPVAVRRRRRVQPKARTRIPVTEFAHLLNCAPVPRDRIIVALGMYLLVRQSEIKLMRVGDVNLVTGEIEVTIPKTSQRDPMPISTELDRELRTWLTTYAARLGRALRPEDYLAPAQARPTLTGPGIVAPNAVLYPDRPMSRPYHAVQRALEAAGYRTRNEAGASSYEGVHTLRRSAARARFDYLADNGHDYAIRHVQSLLHHKSLTMTEHYIGIEPDRARRDEMIRGKEMFPIQRENVIELRRTGGDA